MRSNTSLVKKKVTKGGEVTQRNHRLERIDRFGLGALLTLAGAVSVGAHSGTVLRGGRCWRRVILSWSTNGIPRVKDHSWQVIWHRQFRRHFRYAMKLMSS
jgi:hypothetical protein